MSSFVKTLKPTIDGLLAVHAPRNKVRAPGAPT